MPIKKIGKIERTKKAVKNTLNINKYNKWLFIFETILLIGVLDEYLEGFILGLEIDIYWHILLLMILIGTLFTFAFSVIEPWTKKIITWTIRINQNKVLRTLMHIIILGFIYFLYAKVFFATNIGITFDVGLNIS